MVVGGKPELVLRVNAWLWEMVRRKVGRGGRVRRYKEHLLGVDEKGRGDGHTQTTATR